MRKIPTHITDTDVLAQLNQLAKQIEEKMQQVNVLRDKMKKKDFTPAELESLKKIGGEIDSLDQEWKALAK